MAYVPNPADPTAPLDTDPASSAAEEFRALKAYIAQLARFERAELVVGAALPLVTSVPKDILHLDLAAGAWDVTAQIAFNGADLNRSNGQMDGWVSTTSATIPVLSLAGFTQMGIPIPAMQVIIPTAPRRFVFTVPTTVYMTALCIFNGTASAYGCIEARGALP